MRGKRKIGQKNERSRKVKKVNGIRCHEMWRKITEQVKLTAWYVRRLSRTRACKLSKQKKNAMDKKNRLNLEGKKCKSYQVEEVKNARLSDMASNCRLTSASSAAGCASICLNASRCEASTYVSAVCILCQELPSIHEQYFHENLGAFFFDRRSDLFSCILEAHSVGKIHVPSEACGLEILEEIEFWNIPRTMIAPCCIGKINASLTQKRITEMIREELLDDFERSVKAVENGEGWRQVAAKMWIFLEFPVTSAAAKTLILM
ncbi:potassium voltage-gated channel subfamily V member 1-like [Lineus longissimus]|uniref:potassium voltage-gated channel subfamily V member 1-like n=1 Tax=Lineus longissimus TaxID=88925 RepID=UPI00315C9986